MAALIIFPEHKPHRQQIIPLPSLSRYASEGDGEMGTVLDVSEVSVSPRSYIFGNVLAYFDLLVQCAFGISSMRENL